MNTDQKLAALQAAFPALGITLGYLGNIYTGRYARDDRSFYIFTTAVDRSHATAGYGERINISCDHRNMTVEQLKRRIMLRFCAAGGKFEIVPPRVLPSAKPFTPEEAYNLDNEPDLVSKL